MDSEKLKVEIERALEGNLPLGPHSNRIQNWWFRDEEVLEANEQGRLLKLDLDVGNVCDLDCSFCFADTRGSNQDIEHTTDRVKGIIDEGVDMGLKVVKIVGAGEPFMFRNLLGIIEYANERGVRSLVFTGSHILGDNNYARRIFGHEGIESGRDLAERLFQLGTSVIVKYLTFDDRLHDRIVQTKRRGYNYTEMRDQGLLNLVRAGLSTFEETRLGVDCLLLRENYKEAVDLFSFFNDHNIFCFMNTSIDCGNTAMEANNPSVLTKDEAQQVVEDLYRYCQDHGVPFDDISPYFCGPSCSQLNHGMFVGYDNTVKACPGGPKIGTYQKGNLSKIWRDNPFRKRYHGSLGTICISRQGKTLYQDFRERTLASLGER